MFKTLSLEHSQGTKALINLGLHGRSQVEMTSRELNHQISIGGSDLNLLTLKVEMEMQGFQAIKDHQLGLVN